jgi:hypothetical protein
MVLALTMFSIRTERWSPLISFTTTAPNNVAVAIPAVSPSDPRCKGANYNGQPAPCRLMANVPFLGGNSGGVNDANNSWNNNISFGGNPPWGRGSQGNLCSTRTICPAPRTNAM